MILTQAAVNDSQTFGAMAEGVELVSRLITRYAIFEELYLRITATLASVVETKISLTEPLCKLYTAILKYLAIAKRYYGRHTPGILVDSWRDVGRMH